MRLYKFNEVVGNTATVTVIQQSLRNGSFPHIALFSGVSGTGKSTCAEICGLYLTCLSPVDDEPCGKCPQCLANQKALQTTGRSTNLIKINAGKLDTKGDIRDLIKEIFVLTVSDKNCVYVIEEAHSLTHAQQTALLEEIDKVASNVYIIFCTTKVTSLLDELRNRAISFNFNRLKASEMRLVLENVCRKRGLALTDSVVKDTIVNHARGVPRSLVEILDFILSNDFGSKTIAEFLGVIDDELFILLFSSMRSPDMMSFIDILSSLFEQQNLHLILSQLQDFVVRVVFLLEGGVEDRFTKKQVSAIKDVFVGVDCLKIASIVAGLSHSITEATLKFKLIQIRNLFQNRTLADVVKDSPVQANIQQKEAEQKAVYLNTSVQQNSNNFNSLGMDFLNSF